MNAGIIRSRYNLKTGKREGQEYVGNKEIPDNFDAQVLDMLVKQIMKDNLFSTTSSTTQNNEGRSNNAFN